MAKRKGISKSVRFRIFARDGFTCRYCGMDSTRVVLVVDHVVPVAGGGTNDDENLITACESCNQGKSAKLLDQFAPTEEDRLRLSQELNEQRRAALAAAQAVEARKEFRQTIIDLWCDIRGVEEVDRRTINVIISYAQRYGVAMVAGWIESAHARQPWAKDYKIGMYVSGIRRSMVENGEIDPNGLLGEG